MLTKAPLQSQETSVEWQEWINNINTILKKKIMKMSMFDKVLALGLVLAVYGISLKAGHNTNKEALLGQMDQVEVTVNEQTDKQKNVDYNQVRKDYQWDLEGAGDFGESFRMWD